MTRDKLDLFSDNCKLCGLVLQQVLGNLEGRSVETGDEYKNTKLVSGVADMVEDRAKQHFREHELPRIIAERGIEHAKENGYVDADGKPI